MNEQGKRVQSRKQSDMLFNRMLIWVAVCIGAELLSLLIRRLYLNYTYMVGGLDAFLGIFRFVGAALIAAGCVWSGIVIYQKKKKSIPLIVTGAVLWFWVISFLCYGYNRTGMVTMCMIPAVVVVLAVIFYLYQLEFFYDAILIAIGMLALWVFRAIYMMHPRMTYCGFAAVCLLMILAFLSAFFLKRRGGKIRSMKLMSAKESAVPIYLTCAIVVAALVAALILGINAAIYIIFVLIGWLLCLAVYYTVKLI